MQCMCALRREGQVVGAWASQKYSQLKIHENVPSAAELVTSYDDHTSTPLVSHEYRSSGGFMTHGNGLGSCDVVFLIAQVYMIRCGHKARVWFIRRFDK